ncbi:DEAD/DEAH box helicase [Citricoccus sp. NR2]|uniref:DEAD/DEAH box helicase n=1 Tax=Citricoccus sp. NR2 TaxID=3004095 RepID=UPI0022DD5AFA|nr:DEAD/DEAH box helicase [Citricoccus sp. NR2]WBL19985.1 DEAD/DEAH box helicase [Citricoccus sp. NR2]
MTSSVLSVDAPAGFTDLGVPAVLAAALIPRGITSPTPIQQTTLPDSLAGRDVLGRGRTGSGKTYAFSLPLAARLMEAASGRTQPRRPRSLVLAPTRELALQIAESLDPLAEVAGLSVTTIFGGVGQNPQVKALQRGVDVMVACPGRLLDLMGQGHADLSGIEVLVIDEADHMADMGFLPMVRRILNQVPRPAQKMLFSATLDAGVGVLVDQYLKDPVTHEADSAVSPVAKMDHHVMVVNGDDRLTTLAELTATPGRTIVFTRTKHGAKRTAKQLRGRGVAALELHGNLSQNARTRNLNAFHDGSAGTLVATDIAARGIHVDDVALVVHADPPAEHKAYLHRSGRTARAGQAGTVITLAGQEQRGEVRSLMRAAKINPTVHADGITESLLDELAPGPRVFLSPSELDAQLAVAAPAPQQPARSGGSGHSNGSRNAGRGGAQRSGSHSRGRGRSGGEAQGDRTQGERPQGGGRGGRNRGHGNGSSGGSSSNSGTQTRYSTSTGGSSSGTAARSGGQRRRTNRRAEG